MAPFGFKLWENAFQTIFIFRHRKHQQNVFGKTLNGRLPPEDGSVRPQTLRKRVSGDSRHFIFRRQTIFFETSNGRLPPKHGSDRRETLPKRVSGDPRHFIFRHPQTFFATKIFGANKVFVNTTKHFSAKCLFWRSYAGLHATGICSSKIHCQNYRFQPSTTLGGGVKKGKTVFVVSFGQKTYTFFVLEYDTMIL